ncbi:MAG: hypothetical protein K6G74_02560 [Bacilli bacterium]|nr:hypothetical protein [Bacilli bacterium]
MKTAIAAITEKLIDLDPLQRKTLRLNPVRQTRLEDCRSLSIRLLVMVFSQIGSLTRYRLVSYITEKTEPDIVNSQFLLRITSET